MTRAAAQGVGADLTPPSPLPAAGRGEPERQAYPSAPLSDAERGGRERFCDAPLHLLSTRACSQWLEQWNSGGGERAGVRYAEGFRKMEVWERALFTLLEGASQFELTTAGL